MKKIFIILISLLIGFFAGKLFTKSEKIEILPDPAVIVDTTYQAEKIAELEDSVETKELIIQNLKEDIGNIKKEVIILKEELKTIPIDSNVAKLKENLEYYRGYIDTCDTLYPKTYLTPEYDTIISISKDNLIDINSAFIDVNASEKIINKQDSIIMADSLIIGYKDSIIYQKNSIISIQDSTYKNHIFNLTKNRDNWKTATIITGSISIILGGLLLWQLR